MVKVVKSSSRVMYVLCERNFDNGQVSTFLKVIIVVIVIYTIVLKVVRVGRYIFDIIGLLYLR